MLPIQDWWARRRYAKEVDAVRDGSKPEHLTLRAAAEAAERTLGLAAYDEQLMTALALRESVAVEVKTGEGKTLSLFLAAAAHAGNGRAVLILCANDYLADRDAAWMGPAYRACGVEVGVIRPGATRHDKRTQYDRMVVYASFREAVFDYLRDGTRLRADQRVWPRAVPDVVLVDELDAALVDTASVPFVVGRTGSIDPAEELARLEIDRAVGGLIRARDVEVDASDRSATVTQEGWQRLQRGLCEAGLLPYEQRLHEDEHVGLLQQCHQAVRAHFVLERGQHYLNNDGRVVLLDAVTGRLAPGRRWAEGLQQAVEAKERVSFSPPHIPRATTTARGFLSQFPHVAGVSGTLRGVEPELLNVYGMPTVRIPTHAPVARIDDEMHFAEDAERTAWVLNTIQKTDQPVLVGCWSEAKAHAISATLRAASIEHETLTAVDEKREAGIIARAGELGRVTIATRLAARGTDIRLGGPSGEQAEAVSAVGGLLVILWGRGPTRRHDDQLRGRSGRQGDPGRTVCAVSFRDEVARLAGCDASNAKDQPWSARLDDVQRAWEGRQESSRLRQVKYFAVLDEQRQVARRRRRAVVEGSPRQAPDQAADPAPARVARIEAALREHGESAVRRLFGVPEEVDRALQTGAPEQAGSIGGARRLARLVEAHLHELRVDLTAHGRGDWLMRTRTTPAPLLLRFARLDRLLAWDAAWSEHLTNFAWLAESAPLAMLGRTDPVVQLKRNAAKLWPQTVARAEQNFVERLTSRPLPLTRAAFDVALAKATQRAEW